MKHYFILLFLIVFIISGCTAFSKTVSPRKYADKISEKSRFDKIFIKTGIFTLTTYCRIEKPGEPITFYIEGDGLAWLSKTRLSPDPTPRNPIGLRLALMDLSPNVIYLARPCQYTSSEINPLCVDSSFWSDKRFSEEVIESINYAITTFCNRYDAKEIHLIGYSGGGAIAALIVSRRNDVSSLRTIAGNLNHELVNEYHRVSFLTNSLNPIDVAKKINKIPQVHFVGEDDTIVPAFIAESFSEAMGPSSCFQIKNISETSHKNGWIERWQNLLEIPVIYSEQD